MGPGVRVPANQQGRRRLRRPKGPRRSSQCPKHVLSSHVTFESCLTEAGFVPEGFPWDSVLCGGKTWLSRRGKVVSPERLFVTGITLADGTVPIYTYDTFSGDAQ